MRSILPLLVIAMLVFTGCDADRKTSGKSAQEAGEGHSSGETARIKDTIILYNSLLAEGYRAQSMNALAQVATEQRTQKAYHHMAALGEGSVKMDSLLKEIFFTDIVITSTDRARAETREKWDYVYLNTGSGIQEYDNSVEYSLRYDLVNVRGKWMVDDIAILSSKEKKDQTFERFSGSRGK